MNNKKSFPRWSRLDNTAKIFPSNSTLQDSKVFRFVCELKESVEPDILKSALDRTLEQFPFFRSVMKKGLFWYYLEESSLNADVCQEYLPPCKSLYNVNKKTLLFRVQYYRNRISLEVYHVLADGTGGMQFLSTLVYYYLLERHKPDLSENPPEPPYDTSRRQKQEDSFQKYYEKPKNAPPAPDRNSYQLKGERLADNRLGIIEGRMPLDALLAYSHQKGVTLTGLMSALLICAIHEGMNLRDYSKPVVINVPVSLRSIFSSKSARNFFTTINIGYDFSRQEDSLDAVLSSVKRQLGESLAPENLQNRMNMMSALEHSLPIRLVPLVIKNPVLRLAGILSGQKSTASISNVGKIVVPAKMHPYIELFSAYASPNRLQASACSFGNSYVISFAGPFASHDVECAFFRHLVRLGIRAAITTNLTGEE